jgi:uncharacterized protein YfdQ (DUF2303 family)
MSVEEIESAIRELAVDDRQQLLIWLESYQAEAFDERIAQDVAGGRLDSVLLDVERDHEAGLAEPL